MGMSRSTYYYELGRTDAVALRNTGLSAEIRRIYDENRQRYGVRRITAELHNRGFEVNHKRVQRLMHDMELLGKRPKEKYHSYKGEVGKTADNLLKQDFISDTPLEKWTTDVSQFNMGWGKCYFSPILDMCGNEIISYNVSLHPNMEQIKDMLDKAFAKFPKLTGLIMPFQIRAWQYQHATIEPSLRSMASHSRCPERGIAMITALWSRSLVG